MILGLEEWVYIVYVLGEGVLGSIWVSGEDFLPRTLIHRDEKETKHPDTAVPCCQQDQKDSDSLDLSSPLEQKSFPSSHKGDWCIVIYESQDMSQRSQRISLEQQNKLVAKRPDYWIMIHSHLAHVILILA